jgi:hypothetical protein
MVFSAYELHLTFKEPVEGKRQRSPGLAKKRPDLNEFYAAEKVSAVVIY